MRFKENEYPHSELTGQVIACAQNVHRKLRPGLDEKLYERPLCIAFSEHGIEIAQQSKYPVHYHGHFIGNLIPDLIVADAVVVDAKVVEQFTNAHVAQILGYLSITGLEVGLLLNFKHASLQVKRIANLK